MNESGFLRHFLATLAYRGGKCLRGAPEDFAHFTGGGKTPLAILAHLGDLLDWSLSMAQGESRWAPEAPQDWATEAARFHQGLQRLDQCLALPGPLQVDWARLLQGPLADAMTHVGQLAMLRRMAGAPIKGENYFVAEVAVGRLGPDQAPARKEF